MLVLKELTLVLGGWVKILTAYIIYLVQTVKLSSPPRFFRLESLLWQRQSRALLLKVLPY